MRVANYYRVSTKLQQDKFSLSAQKNELQKYAKNKKWKIVNEFKDVESGGKLNKEGLDNLLDVVESGDIDAVLVMDQDRLSRLDTLSWEFLKSVLRENKVKIAEPNGTITDLSNEDDEFLSDLKNLLAQREKRSIVRRMMYGKRQRLREGKGWGVCPFEYYYDKEKAMYFVKEGWGWTIPFIDDLYINKNLGMRSITNKLNKISKTPTGRKWNEHLVHTRLTSKTFHGYQEMTFSNGETISAKVYEPLRTEETYNKIQETRKKRGKKHGVYTRMSTKNINLLKFVPITCGHCGRVISVMQHGLVDKPVFLAYHGRPETVDGSRCNIRVNAKRYEYNLIKALHDILKSEELSKKYIQLESNDDELLLLNKNKKRLENELSGLNKAKDKLLDLYLTTSDFDKTVFSSKNQEFENRIKTTSNELDKINRKIKAINKKEWNYETLYQYLGTVANIGTDLTRHEQAAMIGDLFTKAVLTEETLILTTEIYNGIPIDISIPVVKSTHTVNKWMRSDKREGTVIYRY